jgi:lipoate synthase
MHIMDLVLELAQLTKALDEAGLDYALCGGLALAVYARPRATLDIDLMIEPDTLDRIKQTVEPLGFTIVASADALSKWRSADSAHNQA